LESNICQSHLLVGLSVQGVHREKIDDWIGMPFGVRDGFREGAWATGLPPTEGLPPNRSYFIPR